MEEESDIAVAKPVDTLEKLAEMKELVFLGKKLLFGKKPSRGEIGIGIVSLSVGIITIGSTADPFFNDERIASAAWDIMKEIEADFKSTNISFTNKEKAKAWKESKEIVENLLKDLSASWLLYKSQAEFQQGFYSKGKFIPALDGDKPTGKSQ